MHLARLFNRWSVFFRAVLCLALLSGVVPMTGQARDYHPIVCAHRGASGFLPEHTLEGVAVAYALGADYIEQDVVMTKDNVLIVSHNLTLDCTTDVATRFPDRHREDGRYYAIDFTLEEIKSLTATALFDCQTGKAFGRFPAIRASRFAYPRWRMNFG